MYRQEQRLRLFSVHETRDSVGLRLALADLAGSGPIHVDVNELADNLARLDICTVLLSPKQAERAAAHLSFLVLLRTAQAHHQPASAVEFQQQKLLSSTPVPLHLCISASPASLCPPGHTHPSQPRFTTGLIEP